MGCRILTQVTVVINTLHLRLSFIMLVCFFFNGFPTKLPKLLKHLPCRDTSFFILSSKSCATIAIKCIFKSFSLMAKRIAMKQRRAITKESIDKHYVVCDERLTSITNKEACSRSTLVRSTTMQDRTVPT